MLSLFPCPSTTPTEKFMFKLVLTGNKEGQRMNDIIKYISEKGELMTNLRHITNYNLMQCK